MFLIERTDVYVNLIHLPFSLTVCHLYELIIKWWGVVLSIYCSWVNINVKNGALFVWRSLIMFIDMSN